MRRISRSNQNWHNPVRLSLNDTDHPPEYSLVETPEERVRRLSTELIQDYLKRKCLKGETPVCALAELERRGISPAA